MTLNNYPYRSIIFVFDIYINILEFHYPFYIKKFLFQIYIIKIIEPFLFPINFEYSVQKYIINSLIPSLRIQPDFFLNCHIFFVWWLDSQNLLSFGLDFVCLTNGRKTCNNSKNLRLYTG
jgi:hypothetical protein